MTFDMSMAIYSQDSPLLFLGTIKKKTSKVKYKSIHFIFDNTWSQKISKACQSGSVYTEVVEKEVENSAESEHDGRRFLNAYLK